jgi:hypothetical protein
MNLDTFFGTKACLCEAPRDPEPMGGWSVWYARVIGVMLVILLFLLGYWAERGWWYYRERSMNLMVRCLEEGYPFALCYESFIR